MVIKPVRPTMTDINLYYKEIEDIWETGALTNNAEKVGKLKAMLCEYLQHDNLALFVNGHSALLGAIHAAFPKTRRQGRGLEVITSPFTFVSTTNAIVQSGLIPVFGDIDGTYNLNPEAIEELITPDTCAIITPHIFGIPCDVDRIEAIAKRHNLIVIYDGAQAFGTKVGGRSVACYGDMTMFSFHATKIFNTIEGGMIAYQDRRYHEFFEEYRNFGITYGAESTDVEVSGINGKMNEFQAAMGIVNLPCLDAEIAKRKELAELYCERLKDIEGVTAYGYQPDISYNYAYFPVKIHEEFGMSRDELWRRLKEKGIMTRKLYDKLTYDFKCYQSSGYRRNCPYAEQIKNICLDLPIYGTLTREDILYICDTIHGLRK